MATMSEKDTDDSDSVSEDDVVVKTDDGERYEALGYNKSGEDEQDN